MHGIRDRLHDMKLHVCHVKPCHAFRQSSLVESKHVGRTLWNPNPGNREQLILPGHNMIMARASPSAKNKVQFSGSGFSWDASPAVMASFIAFLVLILGYYCKFYYYCCCCCCRYYYSYYCPLYYYHCYSWLLVLLIIMYCNRSLSWLFIVISFLSFLFMVIDLYHYHHPHYKT